jgi:transcriptional regulator with GAF, ATPase, and Fis domain
MRLGLTDDPINVRIICATNKNLAKQVDEGQFREDLIYRLNVLNLKLPPLRSRARCFITGRHISPEIRKAVQQTRSAIPQDAQELALQYFWHGNIRELRNICERLIVLNNGLNITRSEFSHVLNPHKTNDYKTKQRTASRYAAQQLRIGTSGTRKSNKCIDRV